MGRATCCCISSPCLPTRLRGAHRLFWTKGSERSLCAAPAAQSETAHVGRHFEDRGAQPDAWERMRMLADDGSRLRRPFIWPDQRFGAARGNSARSVCRAGGGQIRNDHPSPDVVSSQSPETRFLFRLLLKIYPRCGSALARVECARLG
jgi:hypothetical protein